MTPTKSRISPRVLAELARKVHPDRPPDDGKPVHKTYLSSVQHWAVVLIVSAWIAMLIAAPILLLLLLFRINYTAEWVVNAFRLLGISFVAGGLYMIADWIQQFFYRKRRIYTPLLAGIGVLAITLSIGFLLWQGSNDTIHPLVAISISVLFLALSLGWGIYRLITERQTRVIFRVLFLIAMLCLGVGVLTNTISFKREFFDIPTATYHNLQTINYILSSLTWVFLLISQAGRAGERQSWSKRTLALLVATIIVILTFEYLVISR